MTAKQAAKKYGVKTSKMKNSNGVPRKVPGDQTVYHRGNKNFAEYSPDRDRKKHSIGAGTTGGAARFVGTGPYRQLSDKRAKKGRSTK